MKFQDLTTLLEQDESIFKPRKLDDRKVRYEQVIQRRIQEYVKNGSDGNLDLSSSPIKSLPEGLRVGNNLYLDETQITLLPAGLKVKKNLDISNSPIKSLPEDLEVGGDLFIFNTPLAKRYKEWQIKRMVPGLTGRVFR